MIVSVAEIAPTECQSAARLHATAHGSACRAFRVLTRARASCDEVLDDARLPRLRDVWPLWLAAAGKDLAVHALIPCKVPGRPGTFEVCCLYREPEKARVA